MRLYSSIKIANISFRKENPSQCGPTSKRTCIFHGVFINSSMINTNLSTTAMPIFKITIYAFWTNFAILHLNICEFASKEMKDNLWVIVGD
jgi:hypothetical protein